jgi:hypothetical protein
VRRDVIITAWGGSLSAGRAQVVRRLLAQAPCPILFLRADHQARRTTPAHQRVTSPHGGRDNARR